MAPMEIDRPNWVNNSNEGQYQGGKNQRRRGSRREDGLIQSRRNMPNGNGVIKSQRRQSQQQSGIVVKNQQQHRDQQNKALRCVNCPKMSNHDTQDCRKNRRQQGSFNNDFNNDFNNGFNNNVFNNNEASTNQAQNAPNAQAASIPYCPRCNVVGHHEFQCGDKEALLRYIESPIRCLICGTRGHTKDQCNNPCATKCRNCCRPGHSVSECRIRPLCQTYRSPAGNRFEFRISGSNNAWPLQFTPPGARPRVASITMTDASSVSSITCHPLQEEITQFLKKHSKIDHSCTMYSKHCADHYFQKFEPQLLKMFEFKTLVNVKDTLTKGWHYFRDPEALEALRLGKKPVCNACGKHGVILDRWLCPFPAKVDILTVEDFNDWGVFVHFQCGCSAYNFHYAVV